MCVRALHIERVKQHAWGFSFVMHSEPARTHTHTHMLTFNLHASWLRWSLLCSSIHLYTHMLTFNLLVPWCRSLLCSSIHLQLRVQESEGDAKNERIHRLLEKNLEAVVETPDGGKQRIATRKQRMVIKAMVPPAGLPLGSNINASGGAGAGGGSSAPQQRQFDLLKMADAKVQQLDTENRALKDDKAAVGTQLKTLQAQVQRREDEIERLGRLLEGGRPAASVRADGETKREERRLAQLGNQVDYLQQTNKVLHL
jgi:hypothetical protein